VKQRDRWDIRSQVNRFLVNRFASAAGNPFTDKSRDKTL
jgi:hypothetical protein